MRAPSDDIDIHRALTSLSSQTSSTSEGLSRLSLFSGRFSLSPSPFSW
jgi:hypothetical protein